ncbi:hypothetical protein [Nocardioides sp. 1609]|uniref:hypothetical protein n=1 Tax=Nocardioides sp. 1609 TaxID=2508327 RepID=UPI00107031B7|nr:hypothetical protein [Nocardioides sp. 1609]
MSRARQQLFVHVGMQKTGTSYLQDAMLRSSDRLAAAGTDLVPPTKRECFDLMVVLRDRYEGRRDPATDRATLERFTQRLAKASGERAVYSQESLAGAGPRQIARLLQLCGEREVHVVVTVRDLARQLSSSWQQELKAGSTVDLPAYLRQLRRAQRAGKGGHPWIHLDPALVLSRWAEVVPAERLHVVTVPPSGAPTTELLERFARAVGFDPTHVEPEDRPSNSSLGLVQAEVLRRVNAELPPEVHRRWIYAEVVKRGFSAGVLVRQQPRKILVPRRFEAWCEEVTAAQRTAIETGGYALEGSLDDLACPREAFTDEPVVALEEEVASASVAALATILARRGAEVARVRDGRIGADPVPDRQTLSEGDVAGDPTGVVGRLRRRIGR